MEELLTCGNKLLLLLSSFKEKYIVEVEEMIKAYQKEFKKDNLSKEDKDKLDKLKERYNEFTLLYEYYTNVLSLENLRDVKLLFEINDGIVSIESLPDNTKLSKKDIADLLKFNNIKSIVNYYKSNEKDELFTFKYGKNK